MTRSAYIHAFRLATIGVITSVKVVAWRIERLASCSTRNCAEPQATQITRMAHEPQLVQAREASQTLSIHFELTFEHFGIRGRGAGILEVIHCNKTYTRPSRSASSLVINQLKDTPRRSRTSLISSYVTEFPSSPLAHMYNNRLLSSLATWTSTIYVTHVNYTISV
jgi:hypothetical protein